VKSSSQKMKKRQRKRNLSTLPHPVKTYYAYIHTCTNSKQQTSLYTPLDHPNGRGPLKSVPVRVLWTSGVGRTRLQIAQRLVATTRRLDPIVYSGLGTDKKKEEEEHQVGGKSEFVKRFDHTERL
jgi:hypothetical protein